MTNDYQNKKELKRLASALDSEEIKPLYKKWQNLITLPNKIANSIGKPFIIGLTIAALYLGHLCYNQLKLSNQYKNNPEIIKLEQIAEKQEEFNRKGLYVVSYMAIGGAGTLIPCGIAIINARKTRKRLEEALNKEGLSLEMLARA